jgi:hypothetical protein
MVLFHFFIGYLDRDEPTNEQPDMLSFFLSIHLPICLSFVFLIFNAILTGAGAMFDWTLFNNSNQRKVVRQPLKVVMFDSDYVQRKIDNY